MNTAVSTEQAITELAGTSCKGCGGTKKSRMSHCSACYYALPHPMRRALYRRVGQGYEQAYSESLGWLAQRKA